MMILPRFVLSIALASLLALGSISIASAQDTPPSRMEKIKTRIKHNREVVRACRQEAIDKNIPRRDRAAYEEGCLKRTK
jgi:hypothetical protein